MSVIPLDRLSLSLALVALAMLVSRRMSLGLEKDLAWGALRAALQLIAIGYLLHALLAHAHPFLTAAMLAVMVLVAGWTSARRVASGPGVRPLFLAALASVFIAALVSLGPVVIFVLRPEPLFDARTVVPLAGMMLANAMNVVAQVFERLFAEAASTRDAIEQRLSLGASPKQALAPLSRAAVRSALLPTLNGLLTVGLVALPGMMSGQILSGVAPDQAVRYQLVVMYQLVAVAAVAGALAAFFARRLLFTERARLAVMPAAVATLRGRS